MSKHRTSADPPRRHPTPLPEASADLKAALLEAQTLLDAAHVVESTLFVLAWETSAPPPDRVRHAVAIVRDRSLALAANIVRVSAAVERFAARTESAPA